MRTRVSVLGLLAAVLTGRAADAQVARKSLPVDLGSGAITGTLPFDEGFVLTAPAPASLLEVRMWVSDRLPRAQCARLKPAVDAATPVPGGGGRRTFATALGLRTLLGPRRPDDAAVRARTFIDSLYRERESVGARLKSARAGLTQGDTIALKAEHASLDVALQRGPVLVRPASVWSRGGLDSVSTMTLSSPPIEPNREYLFCFQLVRRPSAQDSADFERKALANVSGALRKLAQKQMAARDSLDSLQVALVRALPSVDSIEFLGPDPVFLPPPHGETELARTARRNRLADLLAGVRQQTVNREDALASFRSTANALRDTLVALAGHSVLARLARASADTVVARAYQQRFASVGLFAASLAAPPRGSDAFFIDVARGGKTLDERGMRPSPRSLDGVWVAAELAPLDSNLRQTSRQLDSLRVLAALVRANAGVQSRAGIRQPDSLTRLIATIDHAQERLASVRQNLANVATELGAREAAARALVATVRAIDFARIVLVGSTARENLARANTHVSLDAGLLGGRGVREIVPYLGANIYMRPVNPNMHLGRCWCLTRRVAGTVGVTAASVKQDGRIADLFNSRAVLLGGGVRVLDFWRMTGGALVVKSYENGAEAPPEIAFVPSIGTAVDVDLVNLLGKFGSLFFPSVK